MMKIPEQNINALNLKEKTLLKSIMNDKYSCGAFSGMITNLSLAQPTNSSEWILKQALSIRLLLLKLSE